VGSKIEWHLRPRSASSPLQHIRRALQRARRRSASSSLSVVLFKCLSRKVRNSPGRRGAFLARDSGLAGPKPMVEAWPGGPRQDRTPAMKEGCAGESAPGAMRREEFSKVRGPLWAARIASELLFVDRFGCLSTPKNSPTGHVPDPSSPPGPSHFIAGFGFFGSLDRGGRRAWRSSTGEPVAGHRCACPRSGGNEGPCPCSVKLIGFTARGGHLGKGAGASTIPCSSSALRRK